MIQKNNLKFLLVGLFFCIQTSFAQSGFIGKKNEVSFDATSIAFGKVNGSYKYSYSKRTSLIANFGIQNTSKGSSNSNRLIDAYVPAAKCNGLLLGLGFLWNSKASGMNMPIGYYTGFSIDYFSGKLINTIPKGQLSEELKWTDAGVYYTQSYSSLGYSNSNNLNFNFKISGYNFNFYYGKNIYLAKSFTLDILLKLGIGYYLYKPSNFTAYPSDNPNAYKPKKVGYLGTGSYSVYDKTEGVYYIKNGDFNLLPDLYPTAIASQIYNGGSGTSSSTLFLHGAGFDQPKTIHYFKIIALPQIKVGYLF
jgi:hypothetical protein